MDNPNFAERTRIGAILRNLMLDGGERSDVSRAQGPVTSTPVTQNPHCRVPSADLSRYRTLLE